jgi:glycosyltransferase involved in cell wall biosynthesis
MRIVFLSYNYSPDIRSPQEWLERIKYYVGWSEILAKKHTIIRIDQINFEGNFYHLGIQYHFVRSPKKRNYFPRKLHHFVKALRPDLVVVSSFLFPLQVIQLRNCLGKKIKITVQHHAEQPFKGLKKYIQRYASQKTDAFLFTSYEIGAEWVKNKSLVSEKKIFQLMEVSSSFYPVSKEAARKITQIDGSPSFLWVGRLNPNKDPLTAVRAFLLYAELQPNAKLHMIYHTEELLESIQKLLSQNLKNNSVSLIGKIAHNEMVFWFNSADFYLSASHHEGSGTALCEAMSCGCIPIVSDIPSFRMISGNSGFLYEPGSVGALLTVLKQSQQINLYEKKKMAIDHFKAKLSFDAIADQFEQLIQSFQ